MAGLTRLISELVARCGRYRSRSCLVGNRLLKMAALPPSPLEDAEKLEQLRALEHGARIRLLVVDDVVPIAIDTPEDLEKAQEYLQKQNAAP